MIKMILASIKMKFRDKTTLFYALAFPIIFLSVFGLFDMDHVTVNVALIDQSKTEMTKQLSENFKKQEHFKITELSSKDDARLELKKDKQDIILELKDATNGLMPKVELLATYKKENSEKAGSAVAGLNAMADEISMEISKTPRILEVKEEVTGDQKMRYFDFIFPGILGMGLMTFAIFGASVTLTRLKENHVLKRVFVTPMKSTYFFLAETTSYLIIATIQVAVILAYSILVFDAHIAGNLFLVFALALLGNLIFVNIGFLVSSISKSSSSAEGLANIVAMPMMFLSGTFFDVELLPKVMQGIVQYLPLTPLLDAMRVVIIDGEGIGQIGNELLLLSVWFVGSYLLLAKFFKFREE